MTDDFRSIETGFFVFEGVDGVGKTTQQSLFCDWLAEQGREVIKCRDPGGTGFGVYKLAVADKSRHGGGSEPFKWMGAGVAAILLAGSLITILNGIAG